MGLSRLALARMPLALMLLAGVLFVPAGAGAQAADEARALFERGTAAVQAGQFAEARADLESSLALVPHPSTAFNLVVALRGLGEVVAAEEVCARALEPSLDTLDAERRREAASVCADVRAAVAHLTIRAGGDAAFELRVDGHSLGELAPREVLERSLDPGDHVLSVLAPGRPPHDHAVALPPGARVTLELAAAAPPSDLDVPLIAGLVAAAVAIVAAVVVTAAVVATQSGEGADYPVVATLTRF